MIRTRPMRVHASHAALLLLTLLALFWRAVIPGGFMPDWQDGGLVVTVCTEQGLATAVLGPDGTPKNAEDTADTSPAASSCAFASLGLPVLPAAPTALLALALAFILLSGQRPIAPTLRHHALRLRPPLRAPPVPARA